MQIAIDATFGLEKALQFGKTLALCKPTTKVPKPIDRSTKLTNEATESIADANESIVEPTIPTSISIEPLKTVAASSPKA